MHNVSANYTLPAVLNSVKSPLSSSVLKARDTTTTDTGNGTSINDLGTTFLNLLSTELQNQDPTDPVDSTQMVGQMISLNQLDQLISINQAVGGSTTSATGAVQHPAASSRVTPPADAAANTAASAGATALPFDPSTLMPAANTNLAAALYSGLSAAPVGLSGNTSNATGGK